MSGSLAVIFAVKSNNVCRRVYCLMLSRDAMQEQARPQEILSSSQQVIPNAFQLYETAVEELKHISKQITKTEFLNIIC